MREPPTPRGFNKPLTAFHGGFLDACQRTRHLPGRYSRSLFDHMLPLDARAKQIARVVVIILGVISLLKYIAVF
jgi:hypothetical protein